MLYWDDKSIQSVWTIFKEVTKRCRITPKETESWSCRVNVAVCLAALEERTLHQLQLRSKRLMGKTAQQESEVRRPLSARANWSLWPELTPTFLWRNTYTCMEQLWQQSSIKCPTSDQGGFCCAPGHQSVLCGPASPPEPPTVTAGLGSWKDWWLLISSYFTSVCRHVFAQTWEGRRFFLQGKQMNVLVQPAAAWNLF